MKHKRIIGHLGLGILLAVLVACTSNTKNEIENKDPLPSWNEGATKSSIINFVNDVTDETNPNFVKPADRIATFDNDGTLWSEQPIYFQFQFTLDRIKAMAPDHPEWKDNKLLQAVINDDMKTVLESGRKGLMEIILTSHAGMTTAEFEQIVKGWITTAKHPRFNRPFTDLVYQPMLELLDYLRAYGFKTFIVSGGGIEFLRPWVEAIYGIPPDQVVGSSINVKFEMTDTGPVLRRLPELDFIDDKAGKPVGIHKFIGRRPIAAFGNSDGDLQMLQWTAAGKGKRLMVYIHHTDAEREWAYDRESHIGRLDKGLDEANEKGWTVVDMKKDWKVIYPFEIKK